jgi:hypothetical protein
MSKLKYLFAENFILVFYIFVCFFIILTTYIVTPQFIKTFGRNTRYKLLWPSHSQHAGLQKNQERPMTYTPLDI